MVVACSRAASLGQVPSEVVSGMIKRVEASGSKLPTRSILKSAFDVAAASRGNSPGLFCISVNMSRRNSRETRPTDRLLEEFLRCDRQVNARPNLADIISTHVLTYGISINGRPWASGDYCAFVDDPHGELPAPEQTKRVGSVDRFFVIKHKKPSAYMASEMVIVSAHEHELKDQTYGMLVVSTQDVSKEVLYFHADRLITRLKRLPHSTNRRLWIGLPIFASI